MNQERPPWLSDSWLSYANPTGESLKFRLRDWTNWLQVRRDHSVWPYSRVMKGHPGSTAVVYDEDSKNPRQCLNFGSQDYLSLSAHPDVVAAAISAAHEFGVHSAGSPVLAGRTSLMFELETRLAHILRKEACAIFPTGWAAGFGVTAGLARPHDGIVIDVLAHSCLVEGAKHATDCINRFSHNNIDQLESTLKNMRERNPRDGLFIIVESLYSMDSDSPDLAAIVRLARNYEAITILDVAHDLGSMGRAGRGLLDSVEADDWPEIVMGSFSKTFASNGGFVAASRHVIDYLRYYSSPFTFSNALSPVQTSVVNKCVDLVFSPEGDVMRQALSVNVKELREGMGQRGFQVAGTPSPIVPVFVGDESKARLVSRNLEQRNLLANLVEYPAVPRGQARFRFQVMRNHSREEIAQACELMKVAATASESEATPTEHPPQA